MVLKQGEWSEIQRKLSGPAAQARRRQDRTATQVIVNADAISGLDGRVDALEADHVGEAPQDGTPYAREDAGWVAVVGGGGGGSSVSTSDTAPTPTDGALWWDSDEGNLYVGYDDGDSTQWVPGSIPGALIAHTHAQADVTNLTSDLALKVAKAGDTMSGDLTINKAAPIFTLNKTGNEHALLQGARNGVLRWSVNLGDSTSEGGSNAGSNFGVSRYSDAGAYIDTPFTINRATSNITVSGSITTPGISSDFHVSPGVTCIIGCTGAGNIYLRPNGVGSATGEWRLVDSGSQVCVHATQYKPGGGPWADSSDARVKTILGNYNQGLKELRTLHPKRFTYRGNDTEAPPEEGDTVPYENSRHKGVAEAGTVFYGVTAQDVEPKFPEMVTKVPGYIDGQPVTDLRILDTNALIWALVNAAEELASMNEALAARVTALEAG